LNLFCIEVPKELVFGLLEVSNQHFVF